MIGNYRIYYWEALSPVGHSGWVVAKQPLHGGFGEILSKHELYRDAIAAAKRYAEGDKRRGLSPKG